MTRHVTPMPPLPAIVIEPPVRAALLEDLGLAGDITTEAAVPAGACATTLLVARQPGPGRDQGRVSLRQGRAGAPGLGQRLAAHYGAA